jgi:hypothetical protein
MDTLILTVVGVTTIATYYYYYYTHCPDSGLVPM